MAWTLDRDASKIRLLTRAEGFLSPLAHDLELVATPGELLDGETLVFPAAGVRVVGAVKKGRVDEGALSVGDRFEIDRRVREELLAGDVRVTARRDGRDLDVTIAAPRGRESRRAAGFVSERDGVVEVRGELSLSMKALGVGPVKGPMNMFRMKDEVTVIVALRFTS
ncbi:MAG: hypothetical protein IT374_06765 [Polyangiaceae bacterium]|nr:hypothetical protein [Polyangiaceae bacterium]